MRGVCGADQDVDVGEGFFPVVEMKCHSSDFSGELGRPFIGSVGDDNALHAA